MRRPLRLLLPPLALAAGALLGACGSGSTRTVTDTSPPGGTHTATTGTTTTHSSTTGTASTPSAGAQPSAGSGGTSAPSQTRTASEPAFAQGEGGASGPSEADKVLSARGYTPVEPSTYHAGATLTVLVGKAAGGEEGFFFLGGHYLGTDTVRPSASVRVAAESNDEVTLMYPLYRPGDPAGSPTGGHAAVTFTLNNGKLVPSGAIPSAEPTAALSRR